MHCCDPTVSFGILPEAFPAIWRGFADSFAGDPLHLESTLGGVLGHNRRPSDA